MLVVPVPPSVEPMGPVVLLFKPVVVPFTLTEKLQAPPAAKLPPVRLIEPDPAVAVTIPPHEPLRPLGVATTSPAGSPSVKLIPLRLAVAFGLVMVKVKLVVPLI